MYVDLKFNPHNWTVGTEVFHVKRKIRVKIVKINMDSQTYQVQIGNDDTREINTDQESLQPLPGPCIHVVLFVLMMI